MFINLLSTINKHGEIVFAVENVGNLKIGEEKLSHELVVGGYIWKLFVRAVRDDKKTSDKFKPQFIGAFYAVGRTTKSVNIL